MIRDFDWVCRNEESHTRKLTAEVFEEIGVQCNHFNVLGILESPTAIKESILHANTKERPTVSIMSRHVIANELREGRLFEARLKNHTIERSFYIAYSKERKHDAFVDSVVNYLLSLNKI